MSGLRVQRHRARRALTTLQAHYRRLLVQPSDIQAHLPTLHEWTVRLRPRWVIELGVRFGVSTSAFLAAMDEVGWGELWSCDIEEPRVERFIQNHPRWTFALGDDRRPDKLHPPPPETCGLLFIDTSHKLSHTRKELELYAPRVERDGMILMHDVDQVACGRAMREWVKHRNVDNSYGLGAIRV